jgi:hypothetical protein
LEPLIHLILPLTALTLLGVDFRKALPLALFGLLWVSAATRYGSKPSWAYT